MHGRIPGFLLLHRHVDRLVQRLGNLFKIIGVDQQGFVHLVGRPGHFTQDEDPGLVGTRGDVLFGHQVHPVPDGGEPGDIARSVEVDQVFEPQGAVKIPDGGPAHSGEFPVDPAHELVDLLFEQLVLGDLGPGRNGQDDQPDLLFVPGVLFQEILKGLEPVCDSLGVVQTVDGQEKLGIGGGFLMGVEPSLQVGCFPFFLLRILFGSLMEFGVVDPHGEGVHHGHPVLQVHLVEIYLKAQQPAHGTQEMALVVIGVKPDQVRTEQPLKHFLPPGKGPEDLVGGKRDVQEKPDGKPRPLFPDHLWDEHQLVIVDPEDIVLPGLFQHRFCEFPVDGLVHFPVGELEFRIFQEIMEKGPDGAVAEPEVEAFHLGRCQGNFAAPVFPEGEVDIIFQVFRDFLPGQAAPPDPEAFPIPVDGFHPGGQAPHAGNGLNSALVYLELNGKTVGKYDGFGHS